MSHVHADAVLERFLEPVRRFLTPEMARELAAFRVDPGTQARVNELARKANEGELTEEERTEYEAYIDANDMIAVLQAQARSVLARS